MLEFIIRVLIPLLLSLCFFGYFLFLTVYALYGAFKIILNCPGAVMAEVVRHEQENPIYNDSTLMCVYRYNVGNKEYQVKNKNISTLGDGSKALYEVGTRKLLYYNSKSPEDYIIFDRNAKLAMVFTACLALLVLGGIFIVFLVAGKYLF